jgi:hypothetical protein
VKGRRKKEACSHDGGEEDEIKGAGFHVGFCGVFDIIYRYNRNRVEILSLSPGLRSVGKLRTSTSFNISEC